MKPLTKILLGWMMIFFVIIPANSQELNFEKYQEYLLNNNNLTSDGLYNHYPVGKYLSELSEDNTGICFYDSVKMKYALTGYEKDLISQHDFMVSERLSFTNFWKAYEDIFHKDLPVFISTDAILHSVHMSYDAMLKDIETYIIIPKLKELLATLHENIKFLEQKYEAEPQFEEMIHDYDVYFTVARKLLGGLVDPYYQSNADEVAQIMNYIKDMQAVDYALFSKTPKTLDFSQYAIRGHYTTSVALGHYFQCMIWLGRTELYLIAPQTVINKPTPEDVRRQIIDALLILESAEQSNSVEKINEIDNLIRTLVGESDNVKVGHLRELLDDTKFETTDLLDYDKMEVFQDNLAQKAYADQKILSQILWTDPFNTEKIKPASAFMLFGQRFIIDSYISGSVVFDKIDAKRMLPSSLDILFALGNNAASYFLKPELDKYGYSKNIAALRYLVDSYGEEYWQSSVYNVWLNAIRTLNAPDDETRHHLPDFMQTAAWQQEKMNTQLASWAQLRHDNLLYAKQSYSGGVSCSNPDAFLEPIPEFYKAVEILAIKSSENLQNALSAIEDGGSEGWFKRRMTDYFDRLEETSHTLADISEKQLSGVELSEDEIIFLRQVFSYQIVGCGEYDHEGWYSDLFYNEDDDVQKDDFVVADVHTAPTDENGSMVGWVWHVGTGNINLAVVTTENTYGEKTAYVGPVMSFHEYVSLNFKRLTDEEWKDMYDGESVSRPSFTDLYLADKKGFPKTLNPYSLPTITTGVEEGDFERGVYVSSYPNPTSGVSMINFNLPEGFSIQNAKMAIYDTEGSIVNNIFSGSLPARNYSVRWDGTADNGVEVPSGVYYCKLTADGQVFSTKIVLTR